MTLAIRSVGTWKAVKTNFIYNPGTVKYKISRSSGGFSPWTRWGLKHPQTPSCIRQWPLVIAYRAFGMINTTQNSPLIAQRPQNSLCANLQLAKMCLGNSPNLGTFSSLPGVKSVLPGAGEFLLIYPKIFGRPPTVLQRGVQNKFNPRGFLIMHQFGFEKFPNLGWIKLESVSASEKSSLIRYQTDLTLGSAVSE